MLKYILWDVDDTLLNFGNAMDQAMYNGFKHFGLKELTPEGLETYKNINARYWQNLEAGTMDRETVLHGRFAEFFDNYGVEYDDKLLRDFNIHHQVELGKTYMYNKYAERTLMLLGNQYKQYAVTNGSKLAQQGKLNGSGLIDRIDGVFISEDIGADKPSKEFFDYVFEKIGSFERSEYVIIGDSLTSDIRGANNAGIINIWYNPLHLTNTLGVKVDYEVDSLDKIPDIIEEIDHD